MSVARVNLWGRTIGAVSWNAEQNVAFFEYTPEFAASGIQVAPVTMPLSSQIYAFPALARATFHGLPGLLADSLPDRFGNALINAWLAREGRSPESFNPVERLCYTGARGMGALEYEPTIGPFHGESKPVDIAALVELAGEILSRRTGLRASFDVEAREAALTDILRVGTSAGGARAKAIIAWNEATNEVRSGQVRAGDGFGYWLLKFDGVSGNKDKELEDPQGYGLIEYAYALMARDAGIEMMECRVLEENGRSHFMTKRFDRTEKGGKLHMLTLGAMAHYDYNLAGAYSYEQAFDVMRQLELPMASIEQQFIRMALNIVARNQDDHVKNIAFLMDRSGKWSLSPAYDVTYAWNPSGTWTAVQQMSLAGKRDGFTAADFVECGKRIALKRGRALELLTGVQDVVKAWPEYAARAGVPAETAARIGRAHRMTPAS
ncbi:MAG TPA: HipA domain-containing protein [Candidatus Krumholzibacteria bacterium]|nr:HipA domain-containing protein [Candidatus Krumholzibacteria bacterium]